LPIRKRAGDESHERQTTDKEWSVSSRALSIAVSIALAFASSVAADPADMSNPKHAATVIQMLARDDAQAELVDRGIPVSEAEKIKVAATRLEESLLQMSLKHVEEVCRNGDRYVRDPVALAAEYDRLENEQAAIRAREVAKLRAEAPIAWAAAVVDAGNNVDIEEHGRSLRGGDLIRSGRVTSAFAVGRACNGYEILRDKAK
jgi:hypothetical protein